MFQGKALGNPTATSAKTQQISKVKSRAESAVGVQCWGKQLEFKPHQNRKSDIWVNADSSY